MEEIKNLIKNIFKNMGFNEPEIEIKKDNLRKDREIINASLQIHPKDAEWFLRDKGEGLDALERLIRVSVAKSTDAYPFILLDINNHKEARKNELIELAVDIAKKVRRSKKAVILEPMPAYERRVIHLKLAEQPDIVTESIGEEPERKIVVRLYP